MTDNSTLGPWRAGKVGGTMYLSQQYVRGRTKEQSR